MARYDPTRWVCQIRAEKCNGIFYVYGEARPCPLAGKCLDPANRRTPFEYLYPVQGENQRVIKLTDPERYLAHAKRSCELRRVFLQGDENPDRKYYQSHKDVIKAKSDEKYRRWKEAADEADRLGLPCGGDCMNCPYDQYCPYEVRIRRPGPKPSVREEFLRELAEDGFTVREISEMTGVTVGSVRARCRRLDIHPQYAIDMSRRKKSKGRGGE